MANDKIIVVGGGLAGLMATIKAAETGAEVDLFSIVPVKRSHSVCAQGGINGAVNTKGEGDSPAIHFDAPVMAMAEGSCICMNVSGVLVERCTTGQHMQGEGLGNKFP